jgi:hypothetical protein
MFNEKYQNYNMFISGILLSKSNTYLPNECLIIDYSKKYLFELNQIS